MPGCFFEYSFARFGLKTLLNQSALQHLPYLEVSGLKDPAYRIIPPTKFEICSVL